MALLNEQERELQEAILFGPAPLGPGQDADAPAPRERLRAFVTAYFDYLAAHLDLVRMSETGSPGVRYRIGAYRFWHRHVSLPPTGRDDPAAAAHPLLAALAAEHVQAIAAELGLSRVRKAALDLADALMPAGPEGRGHG